MNYNKEVYQINLKIGKYFERVINKLINRLFNLDNKIYETRQEQYNIGESTLGFEFKHDRKYEQTGNLYIEFEEKADPSRPNYTPSGILRKDNTKYYVIGDFTDVYIFKKYDLLGLYEINCRDHCYPIVDNEYKTSHGFLIRPEDPLIKPLIYKTLNINEIINNFREQDNKPPLKETFQEYVDRTKPYLNNRQETKTSKPAPSQTPKQNNINTPNAPSISKSTIDNYYRDYLLGDMI